MDDKEKAPEKCFVCGEEAPVVKSVETVDGQDRIVSSAVHPWRGRGAASLVLAAQLAAGADPQEIAAEMVKAGTKLIDVPVCAACHAAPKPGVKLHYRPTGTEAVVAALPLDGAAIESGGTAHAPA